MRDYILLRASEVNAIEQQIMDKKDLNKDNLLFELSIEANLCLEMIKWIRSRNVYLLPLPSDNKIIGSRF